MPVRASGYRNWMKLSFRMWRGLSGKGILEAFHICVRLTPRIDVRLRWTNKEKILFIHLIRTPIRWDVGHLDYGTLPKSPSPTAPGRGGFFVNYSRKLSGNGFLDSAISKCPTSQTMLVCFWRTWRIFFAMSVRNIQVSEESGGHRYSTIQKSISVTSCFRSRYSYLETSALAKVFSMASIKRVCVYTMQKEWQKKKLVNFTS